MDSTSFLWTIMPQNSYTFHFSCLWDLKIIKLISIHISLDISNDRHLDNQGYGFYRLSFDKLSDSQ